ncbi:MAG: helix-turn-helix domain-containing protein [Pirellulales bacterium]|nr:helix-turn-helix domain-containing protein [Pirellulales bacterium]
MSIAPADTAKYLTPPAAAKLLGVTPERVIGWIRAGALRAINLSEGALRPRFRIAPDDLDDFLRAREVVTRPKPQRRRRRKDHYEFYP